MSLIRNSIWNFSGYIIPMFVALPALGYIARVLGAERFGIFTLCTAIVGYASIFDAGLTRAVIREISFFRNNASEKNNIIATSNLAILFMGFVGTFFLYFSSTSLVNLLNVSIIYKNDTILSFKILSITIPIFLMNQIWVSYLEGEENFLNINLQRCISSSLIAGLPAIFILLEPSLTYAMLGLVLGRCFSLALAYICARKLIIAAGFKIHLVTLKRLLKFGGWITVSNILSPVMSYFDRFILSNLQGASMVSLYTAPSEIVNRLTNIPWALARALFPKLSSTELIKERKKNELSAYLILSIICLPGIIIGITFSHFFLEIWLGVNYADKSAFILQVLLVGFVFNSFAQVPFASIQASGKAKVTALVHCIELVPYLIGLYWMIKNFGVVGVAYSWTIRVTIDFVILFYISWKLNNR